MATITITVDDYVIHIDGDNVDVTRRSAARQKSQQTLQDRHPKADTTDAETDAATDEKPAVTVPQEDAQARRREQARLRQQRRRERLRDSVTERDTKRDSVTLCVTERDSVTSRGTDCLIDCNINNINLKKPINQPINQPINRQPVQKSVTRTSRRVTPRHAPQDGWPDGQLPIRFVGDRPNLQIPDIEAALTRWLVMRRGKGYFKLRTQLWEDLLDQVDMTVANEGVAETIRWIDEQTERKRLGRFLEYSPPPPPPPEIIYGPGCEPIEYPPDPILTPEEEAERQAREEAFFQKLGGKSLATFRTRCKQSAPHEDNHD